MQEPEVSEDAARAAILDRISKGVVDVLSELHDGKPSAVTTYWTDDLVVCLLRGAFSPAEQAMVAQGHADLVLQQRSLTQPTQRRNLELVVETATQRKVVGFMGGSQADGVVCHMFLLDGHEFGDDDDGDAVDMRLV